MTTSLQYRARPLMTCAISLVAASCGSAPSRGVAPIQPIPEAQPAATTTPAVASSPPQGFLGTWVGVGEQTPPSSQGPTWDMEVTIRGTAPGPCGDVLYPSFPCRGTWVCEPGFDGVTLRAREQITEGTCVNGAMEMALTPSGDLNWRHHADVDGIEAHAILTHPR